MGTVPAAFCIMAPKRPLAPSSSIPLDCSHWVPPSGTEALAECRRVPRDAELQGLTLPLPSHSLRILLHFCSAFAGTLGKPKGHSTSPTLTSQSRIREEVSLTVPFQCQVVAQLGEPTFSTWKARACHTFYLMPCRWPSKGEITQKSIFWELAAFS